MNNIFEPDEMVDAGAATVTSYKDSDGTPQTVVIPADSNFAQGVAMLIGEMTQGSSEWRSTTHLHKKAQAYVQAREPIPGTRGKGNDEDAFRGYPGKESQDELNKSEFMTIKGDYRRAAIRRLSDAWRFEVPKSNLPGYKLWGMILRYKWVYNEYHAIEFYCFENAEKG